MKTDRESLWRVIYIAHNQPKADMVEQMLCSEGFLVQQHILNREVSGFGAYELRVLESEASEARKFLLENGL